MALLFYSVHYPKPEKEAALIEGMSRVGKIIKSLPGCLFDNAFQETSSGPIMALTIWESREAFEAARPAMIEALQSIPLDEWEDRPRELHMLNSLL
jgi:heme-degrading monooxygenase HmoA